jgi:hypothetical protein
MATSIDIKKKIEEEYKECAKDPNYFIRKYCVISEPKRGRIPFDLYQYQADAIVDFEKFQYNIILKGRQIGISTAAACYALWLMMFHREKKVLVIATKQDTAMEMIEKVKFAFDGLPIWLQSTCIVNNKTSLKFKNGSSIRAASAASDAARSLALSLLILDEAAFIPKVDDVWTAALPTLSTGGKAILISTPNGMGNFFHRKWVQATTGMEFADDTDEEVDRDMDFHPIKLDWKVHPSRDDKWRKNIGRVIGEEKARQEYDADFLGSGANVFDAYKIDGMIKKLKDDNIQPAFKLKENPDMWIWKDQEAGHKYIVAADVARGDGTDFSAFHILDLDTMEQVAEFRGKIDTNAYGDLLAQQAIRYNHAILVVERENVGWSVLQRIIDTGYANLFYMSKDYKVVEVHRNIGNQFFPPEKALVAGFTTNLTTRPLVVNKLDMYMREDDLKINSLRTLHEMEVFIWNKGKAEAQEGYNDDLVMSLGIALWVRDTALILAQQGIELTKMTLEHFQKTGYDGIYTPNRIIQDPYKIPTGDKTGETIDLRWLF